MPRFTILRHTVTTERVRPANFSVSPIASGRIHWDWLFEQTVPIDGRSPDILGQAGVKLLTWSTDPLLPDLLTKTLPTITTDALRLPDHRARYLDFEGEIDGDRGHVEQIATGQYELIHKSAWSYQALLTVTHSRWIDLNANILVRFTQSEDECKSGPSKWALRIGPNNSEFGSSENEASL